MITSILAKIFGTKNDRELRRMQPIVQHINSLEPTVSVLNDEQLEKEVLEEARLSKIWRSKAKQRARRHERPYDKSDLKWAHEQQKKWHKNNPELEEFYLKEIEAASEAAKSTKNYLAKILFFSGGIKCCHAACQMNPDIWIIYHLCKI